MFPGYFMYMEDVDLCRSLRSLGLRIDYLPALSAVHFEAGGKPWIGERALLNTTASYMTYVARHYGPVATLVLRLGLAPVFAARALANLVLWALRRSATRRERAVAFWSACRKLVEGR
jgi:GT2 family glycosyltransferase